MTACDTPVETRRRVALDLDCCIECRTCAAACFYGRGELPTMQFARVGAAMLPVVCRQCAEAPCVTACPVEAMIRDERGVVRRLVFRCTGCESCVRACPFGVLTGETFAGEIAKCDLCADRLSADQLPRCVASCPSGALQFIDEHEAEQRDLVVLGSRTLGQHPTRRR